MRFFTWIAGYFYWFFLYIKADIYSNLFGKKILNEFLCRANQDTIFRTLLKEAEARGLHLTPLPGFYGVSNVGMLLFKEENPKKIAISIELMKNFLKKRLNYLNFTHLSFAHELGHFDQINLEAVLAKERQKTCKVKKDCLYEELFASRKGVQIIREITGKEISKKLLGNLVAISLIQCHRYGCLDSLRKDVSQCPKIKEVKEMVVLIFKKKEISFLPSKEF